jgi:hypothetical protein
MKTAIVFTNDKRQLVLTPEDEYETALVKMMFPYRSSEVGEPQYKLKANLHLGSFYNCQGGWYRESKDDDSLIFVFEKDEDGVKKDRKGYHDVKEFYKDEPYKAE